MIVNWPNSLTFWQHQRVTVTGGAGFLGSYVVRKLRERGAEVFVPRRRDYDLRDVTAIRRMLAAARPEIVIHLAAQAGGIGANREHPAEFFYDNLMMGVQLLHESWRYGIKKFVAIGTVCAYPKVTPVPFREADLWNGYPAELNAPYGLTKRMLLVQSQIYRQQYGLDSIFLIPVGLYGPGANFNPASSHVIPALIKKCVDAIETGQEELVVWGDGTATREFLYVEDGAEGILLATERYSQGEPVNLGSAFEISIRDLAQIIAHETGFTGRITWDTSQPNGQLRRKLDITRAEQEFGFQAQLDFQAGLRQTIAWYCAQRGIVPTSAERVERPDQAEVTQLDL